MTKNGRSVPEDEAQYACLYSFPSQTQKKEAELTFYNASHTILYETVITFPFSGKEAGHE